MIQHDLLGDELPDPVLTFCLLVVWGEQGPSITPIPIRGDPAPSFLREIADDLEEHLIEEYTE